MSQSETSLKRLTTLTEKKSRLVSTVSIFHETGLFTVQLSEDRAHIDE